MSNTAEILNFPAVVSGIQEQRVADTDDGYTRLANELYEELIGANLTKNQAKVAHAVCRKTYGFNKKMDRIADSQLSELTRLPRQKVNAAKNELIAMNVLVSDGMLIGPNKNLSEWVIPGTKPAPKCHHSSDCHHGSDSVPTVVTKSVTKTVTTLSPKWGHTKDTITKDNKDNINKPPKSPKPASFDPAGVELPEWLSVSVWKSWVDYRRDLKKPIKSQQTVIGLATPVKIRIECHMPDRRRRDLDNLQKAAFDALTKAGFWQDDQQVDDYRVKRMPIIKGGKLEFTITELEPA